MTRCIVSAIVLALIAAHATGEDDLATQIKALQKERIEVLTKLEKPLVEFYRIGRSLADPSSLWKPIWSTPSWTRRIRPLRTSPC